MTGIQAPYEEPTSPDVTLDTEANDVKECVQALISAVGRSHTLAGPQIR